MRSISLVCLLERFCRPRSRIHMPLLFHECLRTRLTIKTLLDEQELPIDIHIEANGIKHSCYAIGNQQIIFVWFECLQTCSELGCHRGHLQPTAHITQELNAASH